MFSEIKNPHNDRYINSLNEKIGIYNKTKKAKMTNIDDLFQLLYEINYIHMHIKKLNIDYSTDGHYRDIANFPGVNGELEGFNMPPYEGIAASDLLSRCLANEQGLPTIYQLVKKITSGSFFSRPSEQLTVITKEIKMLNQMKRNLPVTSTTMASKEYADALISFKKSLSHKLAYELQSPSDLKYMRALLHSVDHEIISIKKLIPAYNQREIMIKKIADMDIYKKISQLSPAKMEIFAMMLKNTNAINPGRPLGPSKADIALAISGQADFLNAFDIKKLGGGNNVNWKISDPANDVEFVIQVGQPAENQLVIDQLENSAVNDVLSTPFFTSTPSVEVPYMLVMTELCYGGDLRSDRKRLPVVSNEDILKYSTSRMLELTSICQEFSKQRVVHPDIKLQNFLVNANGKIVIADKKSFERIDDDGNIPSSVTTTRIFTPPERSQGPKKFNAEAYTTYQLGLAFYDCLVLPEKPTDPKEPLWCQKPLEFHMDLFQSNEGAKLKNLITKMTDPDAMKRPKLAQVQMELERIYPKEKQINMKENMKYDARSTAQSNARSYNPEANQLKTNHPNNKLAETSRGLTLDTSKIGRYRESLLVLKNEKLKSNILDKLKSQIESVSRLDDLNELKSQIKKSDEYKILKQSQGMVTKVFHKLGMQTTSINKLNDMFENQESKIKSSLRLK